MKKISTEIPTLTVGLDLGDRSSRACFLETESGEVVREVRMRTTAAELAQHLSQVPRMRIALEVGGHSPWVSRLLAGFGHQVLVANPREVRLIAHGRHKSDRFDARALARLARLDPELLAPVRHRSQEAQQDLAVLRARGALVRTRTLLVNHLRGAVKSVGGRLPNCSAESLHRRAATAIPTELEAMARPLLDLLTSLSEQIRRYGLLVDQLATRYCETATLRQVKGVGSLTSLAFVLTLEDPQRFQKSRMVGAYLGLAPGTRSSGERDPQLHISKEGDPFLRQLVVQSAHYILGPFGEDSDLRRHGQKIAERGGKAAKKRAAIAVARKLAVLLHRLWVTQAVYQPLRTSAQQAA